MLFKKYYSLILLLVLAHGMAAAQVSASFTVSSSDGCKPLNVQFNNTSLNATSYFWDFGNGNTSTLVSPGNIYTSAGTYSASLTATGPSGSATSSVLITVHPSPVAGFTSSATTVCQGVSIQFINQSSGYDSCIWDFGDGITSNAISPSHVYYMAGSFTVTLIAFDKTTGCSSSISKPQYINVTGAPSATILVTDSSSCNTATQFQFTAAGTGIVSWSWEFGDGTNAGTQTVSHVYSDTGYFDITLIVTGNSGCVDTIRKNDFIHLKYNPVPVINASVTQGCIPLNTSFSTSQTNVSSWHWDLGDGKTDSIYIAYHAYAYPGIYTVNLIVEYDNGCTNQNSFSPITVDSIPQFTYTISNNNGCAPLAVNFINNNASAGYAWSWNFGDGDTSSLAVPTHTYLADGTYTVSLYATNAMGCTWGYPLSAKVKVSSPSAAFIPDKTTGCAPLTVNFNNQSTNAVSNSWDFGDGSTSVLANPSHSYNATGIYSATLIATNSNGCSDTFVFPQSILVSMAGNAFSPLPPITACAPFTMHFEDNSPSASWLWDFGDGTTSVLQNPDHTYDTPGTYVVSLSTQGGNGNCSQYISNLRTIIINSGVAEFSHTEELCPPYEAFFHDSSLNAVSWLWDFGDGATSTLQNPSHIFGSAGYHNISLTITTPQGCEATTVKNFEVYFEPLTASATTFVADTILPMTVQFYANTTGATWWNWTFGDGDSSGLQNPAHIYTTAGPHTITLTIGNDSCSRTYNYAPQSFGMGTGTPVDPAIGVPTDPPVTYNCAPFTVNYHNPFFGAVSWLWDFGDGQTSNVADPVHVYTTTGNFQAKLYVQLSNGSSDSVELPGTVNVKAFDADFSILSISTCSGTQITLLPSDTSALFYWEFGDGTTSTDTIPVHIYSSNSYNYLITAVVTDTNGCVSSATKTFYANETNPLTVSTTRACAGDTVFFSNGGLNYQSYLWDFGDGNTSAQADAAHVYADSGLYTVTLSVFDTTGCMKSFTLSNQIMVFNPVAYFTVPSILPYCSYVAAQLNNQSTGYDNLLWNFGNGQTASQTPSYAYYYAPGSYTISLTVSSSVCSSTYTLPAPVVMPALSADFTFTQTQFCTPVLQPFTDLSVDAVSWLWDFGDGTADTVQNPVHNYLSAPAGNITLTVKDIYGCTKKKMRPGLQLTHADFNIASAIGCTPLSVSFSDSSSNTTAWQWDFGDGTTSSVQNPIHIYNDPGIYDVQLIVTSSFGCLDTLIQDSLVQVGRVNAAFSADGSQGCAPLLIQFTDSSVNASAWFWDFGDGSYSISRNPAHIYNVPGIYSISLIATDSLGCSDTVVLQSAITIYGAIPYFEPNALSGCQPFTFTANNLSQGAIALEWNFGNGVTDTSFSPSYIYPDEGSFSVSLTVMDTTGCSATFTYPVPVTVDASPEASFAIDTVMGCTPFSPLISNTSINADSIHWDFGDGTVSDDFNPVHSYTQAGTFIISMTAFNSSGCSDLPVYDTVTVHQTPQPDFYSADTAGCAPASLSFVNTSTGLDAPAFFWSFGNGLTSNATDTVIIYNIPGSYDVSLSVVNAGGCSAQSLIDDYITIYDASPPPPANLYTASVEGPNEVLVRWNLINLNDMDHYVLYRLNTLTNDYDSVGYYMQNNSTIVSMPELTDYINTSNGPETYKILAVDKCGSRSFIQEADSHATVFLSGINSGSSIALSWTQYSGCTVAGYRVYRDDGNGTFALIATTDSLTTYYIDGTAFCPVIYNYKVEAITVCGNVGATAFSNTITVDHTGATWDQQVEMVRATVADNSFVLVEWRSPLVMPQTIIGFEVYRSIDMVNYQFLGATPAGQLYFEDHAVDVNNQNYYYKVIAVNYCNLLNQPSNESSSILLNGLFRENGKAKLRWTPYVNWSSGVDHYTIERQKEDGTWEEIQVVNGTATETDD